MRSFVVFRTAVAAALCLATGTLFAAGGSIRDARSQPQGSHVTVEGVVSVASGAFSPNDEGFAVQSGNAGIYIHDALGGSYALGQTVTVTGTLENNFGQVLGVTPSSIHLTGTHPVHPAKNHATGDIDESSEGTLVRVRGTVVGDVYDDAPYGHGFHVDDGSGNLSVFVYSGTGIDVSDVHLGDEVEITGFSGQFIDHYELNPRIQSDIATP